MSAYPPVAPRPDLPEEFQFLCMLHNIGATNPERALTIEEIAKWTCKQEPTANEYLGRLEELGYIISTVADTVEKYHVSVMGIRKVLTLYS